MQGAACSASALDETAMVAAAGFELVILFVQVVGLWLALNTIYTVERPPHATVNNDHRLKTTSQLAPGPIVCNLGGHRLPARWCARACPSFLPCLLYFMPCDCFLLTGRASCVGRDAVQVCGGAGA
jgi:hypothetical protein